MKKDTASYITYIGSMLIFGTIGIFRRFIPIPSAMLACIRGAVGALFLVCFIKLRGGTLRHGTEKKSVCLLALTGALIGINWLLLFEAYNYTTVATATLCYYMQPTIVVLLSPVVLKERLTARKLLCAVAAVIGMVFVSGVMETAGVRPGEAKGILFGLGAAAIYAAVIFLNKKVTVEDAYEKTVIQLASASIILVPYLIITGGFTTAGIDPRAVIMILIVGVVHTGIAYALYFKGMDGLKAQSVAVLSYIDPVFALILSALILKEKMTVFGIIGATLIIGSAVISELSPGSGES